jgi:hypothetical protein
VPIALLPLCDTIGFRTEDVGRKHGSVRVGEDVAGTIRVYVSNKDTPRFAEYQRIVPHRFEILTTEYDK